ncbi:uncharacterized protein LOC141600485 isoform X2 [Silene latifolia]|uniref:uncharacterized protein LOC141600485 isoform X2 n=1 Tax=Silene latifolia TaxID=37657 RepID=UPI003D776E11
MNSTAIEALGHLFKLTEIFIEDDGYSSTVIQQSTLPKHIRFKDDDDDDSSAKIRSNATLESSGDASLVVDHQSVTEEMTILGLPLSFRTNKQNGVGQIKRKSKIAQHSQQRPDEQVEESCKMNEEVPDQSEHIHDSSPKTEAIMDGSVGVDLQMNIEIMSEEDRPDLLTASTSSGSNMLDDHIEDDMYLTGQLKALGSILSSSIMQPESSHSTIVEQPVLSDLSEETHNVVANDQEYKDSGRCCGTCGDWGAYWDCFYLRYYFYNSETKESTWHPPPGMENFASSESCCSVDASNVGLSMAAGLGKDQSEEAHSIRYELVDKVDLNNINKESGGNVLVAASLSSPSSDESRILDNHCKDDFHTMDTSVGTIQSTKRKVRRRRRRKSIANSEANELYEAEESYIDITKYWCQRYLLFSKFDHGIKMDEEGWFSVTPEAIARHQASRCGGGTIVDCFAGVGGNAIQFAKTSKHVVAIDIDPNKIDYAYHNAAIYGVQDNIDFVTGDSLSLASELKADSVFLSPPWGGPDYVKVQRYSIHMLQPYDGQLLFDTFKVTARMIIMFLPRNVDIEELAELSLSADPPWSLEVEKNYLNGKLKAVTAYFSRMLG